MYDELQQAVREQLAADVVLVGMLGGQKIYDGIAPPFVQAPYVVVTEWTAVDKSTHTRDAKDVAFHVHSWSDYNGMLIVAKMRERVLAVLDHGRLECANWVVPLMRLDYDVLLVEDDTGLRHNVTRFRCLVQSRSVR